MEIRMLMNILILSFQMLSFPVCHGASSSDTSLCIETGKTEIDCANLDLETFTACKTWNASQVLTLNLKNNKLKEVPDLSEFINLQQLDLSYNKIGQLTETAFDGLSELRSLNIEMNDGLILSDQTISSQVFDGKLDKLRTLRLKQLMQPSNGMDYKFLSPLYATLEELFVTGTRQLSPALAHFSKLHTISLGGKGCNIQSLNEHAYRSLTSLPALKGLSARNCNCSEITPVFLKHLSPALQKLDLSCNPLRHAFGNITEGLSNSSLKTLLLDNINRIPDQGESQCPWTVPERDLQHLKSVPLDIFSFHSNQLEDYGNLKLQYYCPNLIYLDVSYNNLRGATSLDVILKGDGNRDHSSSFWHNVAYQPLGLRYIGIRGIISRPICGQPPETKLDCDSDSYLFLDENFYWDVNHEADIIHLRVLYDLKSDYLTSDKSLADFFWCMIHWNSVQTCLLRDITRSFSLAQCLNPKFKSLLSCFRPSDLMYLLFTCQRVGQPEYCVINYLQNNLSIPVLECVEQTFVASDTISDALHSCYMDISWLMDGSSLCFSLVKSALPHLDFIGCLVEELISLLKERRIGGLVIASDDKLNETIRNMVVIDFQNPKPLTLKLPDGVVNLLPNLTVVDIGDNNLRFTTRGDINNRHFYRNNLETLDLSGSEIGFLPSHNVTGLTYMTNLTLNNAVLKGWHKDAFIRSSVRCLHLKGVKGIAPFIQDEDRRMPFSTFPKLEVLDISETGISYFSNSQIFASHTNLTHLYVQNNELGNWNVSINGTLYLKTLDLRKNNIRNIDEQFRNEMDERFNSSKLHVYLEGNEADCSNCNNAYISWLLTSNAVVDRQRIRCRDNRLIAKNCQPNNRITNQHPMTTGIANTEIAAIVVGVTVILAVVALILIAFNNRYAIIFQLTSCNKKEIAATQETVRTSVYCCHSGAFTDNIAGLIDEMAVYGIDLKSHHLHLPPGLLVKNSVARMMAQSDKVLLFISPDYLELDLSHFELDLLRMRSPDDLVVVTFNVDLAAEELDKLPQHVTTVLLENRHLVFPLGICSGGEANYKAFLQKLAVKINAQSERNSESL